MPLVLAGATSGSTTIQATDAVTQTITLPNATGTVLTTNGSGIASVNGIQFPATQSASADANCLDDYEEGTWTPSIGGGATFTASGNYTKIGRLVSVTYIVDVTNWGSLSGTLNVSGLPFANLSFQAVGAGREDFGTGAMLEILVVTSGTSMNILTYNNTTVIPGGTTRRTIVASATYATN
jgi:hypothetical protein